MIQLFCAIARVILIKYGGNIGRVYGANEGFSSCVAIGLFLYFDDFDYHLKTTWFPSDWNLTTDTNYVQMLLFCNEETLLVAEIDDQA